jgi:hypothetical protein
VMHLRVPILVRSGPLVTTRAARFVLSD